MAAAPTLTKLQAQEVMDYYGPDCVYCAGSATGFDHLQPIAKGGLHEFYNLVPACGSCNSKKHVHPIWRMLQE